MTVLRLRRMRALSLIRNPFSRRNLEARTLRFRGMPPSSPPPMPTALFLQMRGLW